MFTVTNNARIAEYKNISMEDLDLLDIKVNSFLREGWQPYGEMGYSYSETQSVDKYYQTMVRYED